jgi:hypothetical protein
MNTGNSKKGADHSAPFSLMHHAWVLATSARVTG